MKGVAAILVAILGAGLNALNAQKPQKTYKHASQYQVALLDQNLRVATGYDVTLAKTVTDSKLSGGGQGIHLLHTDTGDYRVEAPVNKGMSILATMAANSNYSYSPPVTAHNKWFLDNVQPGTKVLFASECSKPNKKHPNDVVRCSFWFPDPDSDDHEYATAGDFTPYLTGNGSNTQKTANALCGTGKLKPETEAQICNQLSFADPQKASQNSAASMYSHPSAISTPKEQFSLIQAGQASRCGIETNPSGADIYVDSTKVGISPLGFLLLRKGDTPRVITIKLDGYKTVEKTFVPDGKVISIAVTLEKAQ